MNFYVRRISFYVVTLWAAISLNFLLPRMLPGDPAAIMLGKLRRATGGRPLSEETIRTITSILGAEKAHHGNTVDLELGVAGRGGGLGQRLRHRLRQGSLP